MNLCFLLQDQSLLACHAGQVVIEQKIESKKEEIGRRGWQKVWEEGVRAGDMAEEKSEMERGQRMNVGENERMTEGREVRERSMALIGSTESNGEMDLTE